MGPFKSKGSKVLGCECLTHENRAFSAIKFALLWCFCFWWGALMRKQPNTACVEWRWDWTRHIGEMKSMVCSESKIQAIKWQEMKLNQRWP